MEPTQLHHVLIVDDNPIDRAVYKRLLSRDPQRPFTFLEAELGSQGLSLFFEREPACVLLDYNLPDLNGLEFLSSLRQHNQRIPQPVIMLTGEGNEAIAVEAMKRGAQDYLIKGQTTPETLQRAILNTIDKMQLHQQLKQREEDLKQFAYVAAHDLKSPLTRVSNYCQLLQRRYAEQLDERAQRYITEAITGTHQMAHIIDAILEYARIGHISKPLTFLSVHDLLQQAIQLLEHPIQLSQASIEISPALADAPLVLGDQMSLARLFQNLLSNAIKFKGEGSPRIEIRSTQGTDVLRIEIEDHGIGIEPSAHQEIFVAFRRLHSAEEYPGTGIGLATCKRIVEQHAGKIWLESTPGHGTTFFVELPIVAPATYTHKLQTEGTNT